MNVAGIDLSTHAVDVVKLHTTSDEAHWHRFTLEGHDAFDRARTVRDALPCRTSEFWDDVIAIGIEHPAGHHGTMPLLRVQGAILACLPPHLLVHPLPPSAWRKTVGLKGNATKDDVGRFSDDLCPRPSQDWPQDAHDAHLIARATRQLITTPSQEGAPQ